ncbi:MAG: amidohydrolase family protein [Bacteroidota bacterium]
MALRILFSVLLLTAAWSLSAQDVPEPAPAQTQPILLKGGTLHTGTGEVIVGDLLLTEGKIAAIGNFPSPGTEAQVIDCAGKHLYPGLIAPSTQIGLDEIEAVRATEDKSEVGLVNPNARSIIAYNTDSRVTPTVRSNGILLAQVAPIGGLFAGTSSVVQLDAWNYEDAAYQMDDAVHLYWPRMRLYDAWWAPPKEEQLKRRKRRLEQVETAMTQAKAYLAAREKGRLEKTDLRWEAMVPLLKKEIPIFLHAESEQQIAAALAFKLKHDLKMVLVGGQDAWLFTEQLKQYEIPVILHKPHSLPRTEDDDVDISFKRARLLHEAGVLVALSMNDFWNQRNLPFQAGTVAAYGVPKEVALQMITLHTAQILGIAERTGSLEVGKDANVLVSAGDLLDMRTSRVEHAFIQGRKIDLGNKQKDLYDKFSAKYRAAGK